MSGQSNIEDWALCMGCRRQMKFKEMLSHRLPNGDCPDERGLFKLTAKGKRLSANRRRH